jgi:hypothetical protein
MWNFHILKNSSCQISALCYKLILILAYILYFKKIKRDLWDNLAVCLCIHMCLSISSCILLFQAYKAYVITLLCVFVCLSLYITLIFVFYAAHVTSKESRRLILPILVYSIDMMVCIVVLLPCWWRNELCWYRRCVGLYAIELSFVYGNKTVPNNYVWQRNLT